jgi:hypothetical protein
LNTQCPNKSCKVKTKYPFLIKEHLSICPFTGRIAICKGCQVEIKTTNKLAEVEEHVNSCELVKVNCSACNLPFKRKLMKSHVESFCVERTVQCDSCKTVIKAINFEKHDKRECLAIVKKECEAIAFKQYNDLLAKINNTLNCNNIQLKINDDYDINKFKELLSLGIKKLDLSGLPVNVLRLVCLKNNNSVESLNLSKSNFTDEHALILADVLKINTTIKELDLSYNNITYKGAQCIVSSLWGNNTLESLSLSGNILDTSGILTNLLGKFFGKKTSHNFGGSLRYLIMTNKILKTMCFSDCGLTNNDISLLYDGFKKLFQYEY